MALSNSAEAEEEDTRLHADFFPAYLRTEVCPWHPWDVHAAVLPVAAVVVGEDHQAHHAHRARHASWPRRSRAVTS